MTPGSKAEKNTIQQVIGIFSLGRQQVFVNSHKISTQDFAPFRNKKLKTKFHKFQLFPIEKKIYQAAGEGQNELQIIPKADLR